MPRHYSYGTPADRTLAKVVYDHGCWTFTGHTKNGYGRICIGGSRIASTHRVVYEALVGRIPVGMEIDHLCRNRACCNPLHLEPVSHRENALRGARSQTDHSITHCPRGHEYTPENVRLKNGWRVCRQCGRDDSRRRRQCR